jgi:predicted phosphodiesterase
MRIALISDTHGNFIALSAVLADIESQQVDQIIFLGDAATIGSQPNETLDALKHLDCVCIMGNHDAAVLDPKRAAELQIASQLHSSLNWCIERMNADDFKFLRSFRPTHELPLNANVSMLCFHGSPLSNTDLILATTAPEVIDGFFTGQTSAIWTGGHSHIQMLRRHGDKLIINPGSVGNAFHHAYAPGLVPQLLPWAEYAIVSTDGEVVSVDLRRVPFDTQKVLRHIEESSLPSKAWWLNQYT